MFVYMSTYLGDHSDRLIVPPPGPSIAPSFDPLVFHKDVHQDDLVPCVGWHDPGLHPHYLKDFAQLPKRSDHPLK